MEIAFFLPLSAAYPPANAPYYTIFRRKRSHFLQKFSKTALLPNLPRQEIACTIQVSKKFLSAFIQQRLLQNTDVFCNSPDLQSSIRNLLLFRSIRM